MGEEKIVVTVTVCEQVGENAFIDRHHSMIFSSKKTISEILDFSELYVKRRNITDLKFSIFEGESI